jgi:hypothetical protein
MKFQRKLGESSRELTGGNEETRSRNRELGTEISTGLRSGNRDLGEHIGLQTNIGMKIERLLVEIENLGWKWRGLR